MYNDVDDLDDPIEQSNSADEDERKENKSENVNNTGEATVVPVPSRKRIVRNPRLKFNPERLCGDRGIPVIVDHFKNVKFKGKGHEKEDLEKLLSTLEHWTHRLFPSMKFIDCLRHIEKLGKKRPVQTCLRKIRLDMPILSGDFVGDDDDKPEESRPEPEVEEIDAFDALLPCNQIEKPVQQNFNTPPPNQNVGHTLGSSFGSSLTEEQRKKMEYNRMLATERRKAKLSALQCNLNLSLEGSANLPESTRNEDSLNEISYPGKSTSLNGDLSQSTSNLCLEPESESLLENHDKNCSSQNDHSQSIFSMSIDKDIFETPNFEQSLLSSTNHGNYNKILKEIDGPSMICHAPKNNLNDADPKEINEVLLPNNETQFVAENDSEIMDTDNVNQQLNSVEKDVFCENSDASLSSMKLSKALRNQALDMKSSDSTPLSESILEVNTDLCSNSKINNQNTNEIPCTSEAVSTSKEDSDELKMDELMDLIDE